LKEDRSEEKTFRGNPWPDDKKMDEKEWRRIMLKEDERKAMLTHIERVRNKCVNIEPDLDGIKNIFDQVSEEKAPVENNQRAKRIERTMRLYNYINELDDNDLKRFDEEKSDDLVVVTPPGGASVITK